MVNAKFEGKGLEHRVDHRPYEQQGLDLLPTIHGGVAVRQMEAKGATTDRGDLNRWIKRSTIYWGILGKNHCLDRLDQSGKGAAGKGTISSRHHILISRVRGTRIWPARIRTVHIQKTVHN